MRETHLENDKWWVSPYNFESTVRDGLKLPEKVEIHDATLRDGEQTPGVVFSVDDKIEIATKLNELGVDRIEAGMPAVSLDDQKAITEISKLGLNSKIFTFARAIVFLGSFPFALIMLVVLIVLIKFPILSTVLL